MASRALFVAAVVVCWLALARSHPTHYPDVDVELWRERMANGTGMPPFRSYHIHVLFVSNQPGSTDEATAFRKEFMTHFNMSDADPCNDTIHQGRLCMFEFDTSSGSIDSPFVTSEWGMFLPIEHFATFVPWTMQNRGKNIVFVHPNSGMQIEDHTQWAFWQGDIWPLRPSALCDNCGRFTV